MGAVNWAAPRTADSIGGSAFNSLADAAGALSSEVDNSTDRDMFGDLELTQGGAVTSSGTDARVDVFLIPCPDGTTYPDPPGSTAANVPGSYFVGSMSSVDAVGTPAAVSFTRGVLRQITLPPFKFKILLVNELGAAFNASVTLKLNRYNATVA